MLMFVAKQYFVLYLKFQASKEFCLFQKKSFCLVTFEMVVKHSGYNGFNCHNHEMPVHEMKQTKHRCTIFVPLVQVRKQFDT